MDTEKIKIITRKNMPGVYCIFNKINGKIYVGSSNNLRNRLYSHRAMLKRNVHDNNHLQSSWNQYGAESFECLILEECSFDNLLIVEQFYIDLLNCCDAKYGYNISILAERGVMSEDGKKRISESNYRRLASGEDFGKGWRGKHRSEEFKREHSLRMSGKNNPTYGRSISGSDSASWTGGKAKCENCENATSRYNAKICQECIDKKIDERNKKILDMHNLKIKISDIAKILGTSRKTVSNAIRQYYKPYVFEFNLSTNKDIIDKTISLIIENVAMKKIAKQLNIGYNTVLKIKRMGIVQGLIVKKIDLRKILNDDIEKKIIELGDQNVPIWKIAEIVGISGSSVQSVRKKYRSIQNKDKELEEMICL